MREKNLMSLKKSLILEAYGLKYSRCQKNPTHTYPGHLDIVRPHFRPRANYIVT